MVGFSSNSISTLFSGFGASSKNSGTSSLSALTSTLSDYNLIRSGSYKKLVSAYYAKTGGDAVKSAFNKQNNRTKTTVSKASAETLKNVKSTAGELKDSVSALLKGGTNSVFSKTTKTDEEGNTTTDYDTDKIYNAVKSFVDDYNAVVKAADKSDVSGIQSKTANMINSTSRYAKSLSDIGISIDSDNYRLSINEEQFKKADMSKVKSLFNGAGSYAYNVKSQASMIEYKAGNEASKANTYTHSGYYSNAYSSGSMWDSYF